MFILILQRKPKSTNPQTNTQTSEPITETNQTNTQTSEPITQTNQTNTQTSEPITQKSQPSKHTRPLKNSHPTKKSQPSKKTQLAKKTQPAKRTQPVQNAMTQPNGSSVILPDIDPEFEALAADLASAFEATQSQPNVNSVMNSIPSAATKPVKYFMVFIISQLCLVFI